MGAFGRHGMRALLAMSIVGVFGASVGIAEVASAASLPAASSATPGVPTSTIQGTTYCVTNYAPNSDVVVVNQLTGATSTIHTDANGSGCTTIPVRRACSTTTQQTIVATGTGADGHPASSQVVDNAPPDPALCASPTPTPTRSPTPRPTPTPTQHCKPTMAILSIYFVAEGARLRGHACGFTPHERVFGYVHSTPTFLGSTTATANGDAAMRVKLPVCIEPGQHTFMLVGQSSGNVASAQFTVTKAGPRCNPSNGSGGGTVQPVGANSGGGSGGGGSLAFTGADILAMVLVALLLLVLGIALVTVRRRRTAPTA